MSEVINCPHCGRSMQVAPEHRGKAVTCPHCGQALTAPMPAATPEVPPPARPGPDEAPPGPGESSRIGSIIVTVAVAVVAGLLLLGVLAGFLAPMWGTSHVAARRVACMNNVRQIGLASIQYAGDHDDNFMDLVNEEGEIVPTAGKIPTEPARSGFVVLLHDGYLTTTKVFICPSSKDRPADINRSFRDSTLKELRDAFGEENCSYGWDPTKKHSADATCAIIADKPRLVPGAAGTWSNNSENHKDEGQNVFYNDGHVKWGVTPQTDSGADPDIYTGAEGYEKSTTDAKIIR